MASNYWSEAEIRLRCRQLPARWSVRNNELTVFGERYRRERIEALQWKRIVYSGHAIRRMFEWKIGNEDVAAVVSTGEVIMEYPEGPR